jgi:dihydroorotase
MSVLIKDATVLDGSSPHAGKKIDLYIQQGKIAAIGKKLEVQPNKVIEGNQLYVAPGWVDLVADYCEPGYEFKEVIDTGLNAAAAGGFTDVFLVPNTKPVITNASILEFVQKKGAGHKTKLHVLGAVSKNIEGKDLAEMMDMHHSGAIAFSDGWSPIQDAGLMLKALEYVKAFDGIIIQIPVQASLSKGGLMNESATSVKLGMSGIPAMSESLMVYRDLELLRYTGSRIHFSGITTAASVSLIKAAKMEGLRVSCSVTPYHLLYSDEMLQHYDSVYKVDPPLRAEVDRIALIKALEDGSIDCIATHHRPQDWDAKAKEFEYAGYGMNCQETCWPMLQMAAPKIKPERWMELLSLRARHLFNLPKIRIAEQEPATLTVFDMDTQWIYSANNKKSKGINNPLLGKELIGKTYSF